VPGAILIAIAVVFVLPSLMLLGGMVISAILGWVLKTNAEDEHAGSELLDCNY
jgi:mannitol-specific phosphotransferase system IIBC component